MVHHNEFPTSGVVRQRKTEPKGFYPCQFEDKQEHWLPSVCMHKVFNTPELTRSILLHLDLDDLLQAGLVSQSWLLSFKSPLLWTAMVRRDLAFSSEPWCEDIQKLISTDPHKAYAELLMRRYFQRKYFRGVNGDDSYGKDETDPYKMEPESASFDWGGFRNYHHEGFIAAAFNGEVEKLKQILEVDPSNKAAILNNPAVYERWEYFGNFSHTHSACIVLSKDVDKARDAPPNYSLEKSKTGFDADCVCVNRETTPWFKKFCDRGQYHFMPWIGHVSARSPSVHPPQFHGTPLVWATLGNRLAAVKYLCSFTEIDLAATIPFYGATALDVAMQNHYYDVAEFLAEEFKRCGTKTPKDVKNFWARKNARDEAAKVAQEK